MNHLKLAFTALLLTSSSLTFAGGLLTNTNQNIHFNRMFAREGTIGIDGVYSNPAGVAFMSNGFHLSLNNQSAFQTRTIWSGTDVHGLEGTPFYRPFMLNGGDEKGVKKFKGEASAPFIPSVQAAYNTDKWGFQGSFAFVGGGGKASFDEGLGSFERTIALIPMALHNLGMTAEQPRYSVNSHLHGQQYVFGLQLGASYKINQNFAVYGGLRFNYVLNKYEGSITNISANIGNTHENLYDYLGVKETEIAQGIALLRQAAAMATDEAQKAYYNQQIAHYTQLEETVSGARTMMADKYLECTQRGWCITPVIGIDWRWKKLNIGARYEFTTKFHIENDTKRDDTGLFAHGVNTPGDLPGLFTIGAQYEFLPQLRASIGYHYFFDKDARMANDKQRLLSGNTQEYLAGIEYDINDVIQVSIGGQKTNYGLGDGAYLNDMSFTTSSYSIGFGAGIRVAKNMLLNVAYFWTTYDHFKKSEEKTFEMTGTKATCTDEFTRTNKVFGIGLDIDF